MPKFKRVNVAALLGPTPIARITDREVWSLMVTPNVKSLLGQVKSVRGPEVVETVQGFFPGDEVSNLNDHRFYGGQSPGHVRFPYINTMYRTEYGALVIKRDRFKIKVLGWFGDVEKGKAQLIYKTALRDRRYDGTRMANECSLLEFPMDDPKFNAPMPAGKGVELSIYGFLPGSKITDVIGEPEYESFVANPYTFVADPEKFLRYFWRAWNANRAPGQVAAPIPDVTKFIIPNLEKLAIKYGYDFLENAPSHYHVGMWGASLGYRYLYERDAAAMKGLTEGIARLKAAGVKLNRVQESWVCALQSLPREHIPAHLYLDGPVWPQNNIDQQNLWMYKPLNDKAATLIPGPLPTPK
jgi:hypothetical protein